jgi:hypothetical protein
VGKETFICDHKKGIKELQNERIKGGITSAGTHVKE